MAFLADLKWRQHRRPCFRSRKHHRRILALTSNFTTGRFSSPCDILTLADLPTPSLPVKISMIRPSLFLERCAEYLVGEASFVQDCNHDLLATLNQSFPDSTKVRSSGRIELPSNLFLCSVTLNLCFVPFVHECFQLIGCSNKICSVVTDDGVRVATFCNESCHCS